MISTGIISGIFTCQICCQPVAPSMREASITDFGRLWSAASARMKMNGVHCQTSAMTTEANAHWGSESHGIESRPEAVERDVEDADARVVHVAPHETHHDRRDHHRQDEHGPEDRHPAKLPVQEQREADAEHHLEPDHQGGERRG